MMNQHKLYQFLNRNFRRPIYATIIYYVVCWAVGIIAIEMEPSEHILTVQRIISDEERNALALGEQPATVAFTERLKKGLSNHDLRCAENYFVPSEYARSRFERFTVWPFEVLSWQVWKPISSALRGLGLPVERQETQPSMEAIAWGFRGILR
jgi:hypothetical protein